MSVYHSAKMEPSIQDVNGLNIISIAGIQDLLYGMYNKESIACNITSIPLNENVSSPSVLIDSTISPTSNETQLDDSSIHSQLFLSFETSRKEIQNLKQAILKVAKKNYVLRRELDDLSMKIVLLIRNHIRTMTKKGSKSKQPALKMKVEPSIGTTSISDDHIQLYSKLLFLFKNNPYFLSDLIPRVTNHKDTDYLLQTVIFSLFADQFDEQEENILLDLFDKILRREYWRTPHIGSFMRSNTGFTKMIGALTQRKVYRNFLRDNLTEPISKIIEDKDLNLELNPSNIFTELRNEIIEQEKKKGCSIDSIPTFLDQTAALNYSIITKEMEIRFRKLKKTVESVLESLFQHVASAPFGVRYLCKKIYEYGTEKYIEETKQASPEEILSLVGGFVILRYLNPPIATQNMEILGLKQTYPEGLNQRQKINLKYVAKIIQNLSNGILFGQKESYLIPLNDFLTERRPQILSYFQELCKVGSLSDRLELVKFRQLCSGTNNVHVSFNELAFMHKICLQYIKLVSEQGQPSGDMSEDQRLTYERTMKDFVELKSLMSSFEMDEAPKPVENDHDSITIALVSPTSSHVPDVSASVNKDFKNYEALSLAIYYTPRKDIQYNDLLATLKFRLTNLKNNDSTLDMLENESHLQCMNTSDLHIILTNGIAAYEAISSQLSSQISTDTIQDTNDTNVRISSMILSRLYYHVISFADAIEFSKEMTSQLKQYLVEVEKKMNELESEINLYQMYQHNILNNTYKKRVDERKANGTHSTSNHEFTVADLLKQKVLLDTSIPSAARANILVVIRNIGSGKFILSIPSMDVSEETSNEKPPFQSSIDTLLQMQEKGVEVWNLPKDAILFSFHINALVTFLNKLFINIKERNPKVRIKKPKHAKQTESFTGISWKSLH